jgi:uncharacterized membrane protein YkoI
MKKRIFAIALMALLLLGILAGCKNDGPLTEEEAKQIVIEHSGASAREAANVHVHLGENKDGAVVFNVYVTVNNKSYTYVLHATTGEILSVTEGGGHSH